MKRAALGKQVKKLKCQRVTKMLSSLRTYITLSEAARRYDVAPAVLTGMIEDGRIDAVKTNGDVAVAEEDVKLNTKRDRFWNRVKHLDKKPISMTRSCRKYEEINFASLSRWVEKGYIRTVKDRRGGGRGRKRLLNEADVAYTALLLRDRGKKPGKKLFTQENLPPHCIT
jgi:hypothetical protein